MRRGNFYVVATPIGNISDITLRAIETLKNVDLIACEDTRTTKKLLNHYEILTTTFSYHKFNERERCQRILDFLNEGKSIALVSDAGTPCICDPGKIIVDFLYKNKISIISVGGICAISTFLSLVPRTSEEFYFCGFLPKEKSIREKLFFDHKKENFVFYESPNRLLETLSFIQSISEKEIKIAIGRELTKKFEEIKIGNIKEIIDYYSCNILKGEIVVMIYPSIENPDKNNLIQKINFLKSKNISNKDISIILSEFFDFNKNEVYKLSL